ncbi:hypothetical protein HFO38_23870 [Rhizobium leguminosarum]|uniref:winged helix-turn-helix domain-containing protein n=1 Tax=Rhizobium leguminosarum TaxID=384 RepID=UPI001C986770|nr:winged helix-turn-helix domain-containing protein [Rhizobium leguminosarum]MBY5705716.1 hypothetical protein [Rhizobium leguminosarum]
MATPRFECSDMNRGPAHSSLNESSIKDVASESVFIFGPFCVSITERWLRKENTQLNLSSRAFDILIVLISRAGSIVSARELFEIVWPDVVVEASNLRVHIVALRKALDDGANGIRYVINVPGRGYMFVAPVRRAAAADDIPAALQPQQRLPTIPHQLFGRGEVVEKLSSLILSRRFVSVVGPGGVGKTAVSIAAASMLRPTFGVDGVCFIELAYTSDPTLALAAKLSIAPCPFDRINTQDAILKFLSDKRLLLVFDNCEHVIDAIAPLAARIFDEAPSVHLLATSREALRANGENVEFLPPLDHAISSSTSQNLGPAVQLFLERAAAGGGSSSVCGSEAAAVLEICRRLDGLPIAIELVASRVGTHGLLGIAELIERDAVLTLQGQRGSLPRHQTLNALVEWSYNLLSADEQKLLMKLSTFAGAFTLEAVRTLYGQSECEVARTASALSGLVDKSLVQVSRSRTALYYKLLHVTRTYCAHRLAFERDGPAGVVSNPLRPDSTHEIHCDATTASVSVNQHRRGRVSPALEAS